VPAIEIVIVLTSLGDLNSFAEISEARGTAQHRFHSEAEQIVSVELNFASFESQSRLLEMLLNIKNMGRKVMNQ